MSVREIFKFWFPVVLWMAVVFFGSTDLMSAEHTSRFITPFLHWLKPDVSPATIAQVHFYVRKAAHLTEYAILAGLIFRALRGSIGSFWIRALTTLLSAVLFAGVDEFHQAFVASRTASIGDVGLDSTGALIGIVICMLSDRGSRKGKTG